MKLNFTSTKLILSSLAFYAAAFVCAGLAEPPAGGEAFAPHALGGRVTEFNHWHYFALVALCFALGLSIAGVRQWFTAENGSCWRWLGLGAADEKVKAEFKAVLQPAGATLPFFLGLLAALALLPENCRLFGNARGPFMCHTIPNDCCADAFTTGFAQGVFAVGAGLSIAAFVIVARRRREAEEAGVLRIFG